MKHEQKSAELEEFLEQEIKRLERESAMTQQEADSSDIIWDAAEAAVALGKASSVEEATHAVANSDAFAHLTEDLVVVVKKAAKEPEAADGMVSDFQADSAMAIEIDEGGGESGSSAGPGAEEEADEGYLFSAVTPDQALHVEEEGDLFGGGKPPSDDDDKDKDRGKREPKKKKTKKDKKPEADKPRSKKSSSKSKKK